MADKDLFGRALMDHYRGMRYPLYIERDDGHVDEQTMSFYFNDFDKFPESERKALEFAKGKVLDIGVGAGRAALYLQSKGHDVVGIDISDKALEVSRLRGVRKLVKMSACDLKFEKDSFDCALTFFNNFGLCGNMEAVASMMKRLHGIIRKDGVFLAESLDPLDTNRREHTRYHKMNIARGRPPGQVSLRDRYQGKRGQYWDLLLVTPKEMKSLCDQTGWRIEKTCTGGFMIVYVLKKA